MVGRPVGEWGGVGGRPAFAASALTFGAELNGSRVISTASPARISGNGFGPAVCAVRSSFISADAFFRGVAALLDAGVEGSDEAHLAANAPTAPEGDNLAPVDSPARGDQIPLAVARMPPGSRRVWSAAGV